ncbi:MAG: 3-isopropylmalate dehydrogenase [Nitrospinota bacterium]
MKIAILPGDGIGKEVVDASLKVLDRIDNKYSLNLELQSALVGGTAYDDSKTPLPNSTLELAKSADAVLLGAVGGPKWETLDYKVRPERALLALRSELDLYANLRPAKVFSALVDASTLKREVIDNIDIMVIRELVGGIYFGEPRGVTRAPDGQLRGVNTLIYSESEIERIAKVAFELARGRNAKKVCSVDKANVLESTELWRDTVTKVHDKYQDIALTHMYVDNCAMQLIRNPKQFDIIVTTNLFGDILSDAAAMLTGSIGMLPSASLSDSKGMFEPVHGSAPDIAGKNLANPLATILSIAMMLRHSFNLFDIADEIELAVKTVLDQNYRTVDIQDENSILVGCDKMGELVVNAIY